jgi:crotonobetainyl-CoA:carnitine CoA-transferase CaiB-like acyl-CoA transferase
MSFPLSGVRVLDLSTEIAGPYCTKLLADAGADVLKIEPPEGDPLRRWSASGRPPEASEDGVLFRFLNTSKRSAVLGGGAALLELAAGADIVVAGSLQAPALPLTPQALWARNRQTSIVSISPFGLSGPWSTRPATEFTLQAWCGSSAARGTTDRPPIAAGGRLGEWLGGAYAAVAALTAYYGARRGGRGEHVDLALLEVMALTMAPNTTVWESLAGQPFAFGRTVEIPSIEPARDGYVGFCTITAQQWRDFLVLIERPDVLADEELARWDGRLRRMPEVYDMIHAWTRRHAVKDIVTQAAALRIPVAEIGTGATVPRFDHFVARGVFVSHPRAGFAQPRPPYRLSDAALRPLAPAPRLGEHAAEWLAVGEESAPAAAAPRRPGADGAAPPSMARKVVCGDGASGRPLAGLRIIDFTAFWAGPFATHYLAAMGADVIKVESIQRPDGMRFQSLRPPDSEGWWEWGALFQQVNVGKRGITLDLSRPAGVALVRRLLAGADAAVENFSPRVMNNLGLVYDELARLNPRLILVRMPAFGLDGPWRDRVGFAQTIEQTTGMAWLTGFADGPPVIPRGACDPLAGLHALVALLVALEHRARSGRGQLVEATMVEAALNAAAEIVLEHGAHGVALARDGNRGPVGAPQNLYPCRGDDRWLALAVTDDAQWRELVHAMGDPPWACDAAVASAAGRRARHDAIDAALGAWCRGRDAEALAEELLARGIPAAPVTAAAQLGDNPQLQARGSSKRCRMRWSGRTPTRPCRCSSPRTAGAGPPAPRRRSASIPRPSCASCSACPMRRSMPCAPTASSGIDPPVCDRPDTACRGPRRRSRSSPRGTACRALRPSKRSCSHPISRLIRIVEP